MEGAPPPPVLAAATGDSSTSRVERTACDRLKGSWRGAAPRGDRHTKPRPPAEAAPAEGGGALPAATAASTIENAPPSARGSDPERDRGTSDSWSDWPPRASRVGVVPRPRTGGALPRPREREAGPTDGGRLRAAGAAAARAATARMKDGMRGDAGWGNAMLSRRSRGTGARVGVGWWPLGPPCSALAIPETLRTDTEDPMEADDGFRCRATFFSLERGVDDPNATSNRGDRGEKLFGVLLARGFSSRLWSWPQALY
jgi:hypothetical protein